MKILNFGRILAVGLLAGTLLASGAQASLVRFTVTTGPFETVSGDSTRVPDNYDGYFVIDDRVSGPLENTTLNFTHYTVEWGEPYRPGPDDWLKKFSVYRSPGYVEVETSLRISFGERNEITDLWIKMLDGPPDYYLTEDSAAFYFMETYAKADASWSISIVPVPPAIMSFLGGILVLLGFGKTRRWHTGSVSRFIPGRRLLRRLQAGGTSQVRTG